METIIRLNEEGYPIKRRRMFSGSLDNFPGWLIVCHVGVIALAVFTMLIGGS
jgi:hypothetical protein